MGLFILRGTFLAVCIAFAVAILNAGGLFDNPWHPWAVFLGILALAVGVIAIDMSVKRKSLDTISAVFFGLIVGLLLTYAAGAVLTPLFSSPLIADSFSMEQERFRNLLHVALGAIICYTCISVLMQTRNDFRFIIPYVEFAKEIKGAGRTSSTPAR